LSHSKERSEKICLNCNAALVGRYCHVCGQENIEPKETVWSLISHFFYDITHYDGKFFSTTKYLITRPGFLPQEYIAGRRARYLHPIRMYVFSSALFFIIFYSLFSFKGMDRRELEKRQADNAELAKATLDSARIKALSNAKGKTDSAVIEHAFNIAVEPYKISLEDDTAGTTDDWKERWQRKMEKKERERKRKKGYNFNFTSGNQKYTSIAQYDSVQKTLPAGKRDNWIQRLAKHREIELNERYGGNQKAMLKDLLEKFIHTFPYLLFISLPLYAFYLRLLYWRRKQFPYVTHGIFLIYLYIFTFIDLLMYFGLVEIREALDWGWIGWLEAAILLAGVYYAYKAMRRFYKQGRGKTFLKFWILNFLAVCSIIILFTAFFLFAVFKF
jgi:hypothetical protein